jgi:hypothetical protein
MKNEDEWRSGDIAPSFLMNVSGQLQALAYLPSGKSPRYTFDRRLGGPWSRCRRWGVENTLLPLPGIDPEPSSP